MSYFPNEFLKQEILDGTVWAGFSGPTSIRPGDDKYWEIEFGGSKTYAISVAVTSPVPVKLDIWAGGSSSVSGTEETTTNMNKRDYFVSLPDFGFFYDPTTPGMTNQVFSAETAPDGHLSEIRAFDAENGLIFNNSYNGMVRVTNNSNVTGSVSLTWIAREIV